MQLPVEGVPNSDNFKLGILAEAGASVLLSKREVREICTASMFWASAMAWICCS